MSSRDNQDYDVDDYNNPWQKERKKSVHKPDEKIRINLFNRFSCWEEDESEDESEFESGVISDGLTC